MDIQRTTYLSAVNPAHFRSASHTLPALLKAFRVSFQSSSPKHRLNPIPVIPTNILALVASKATNVCHCTEIQQQGPNITTFGKIFSV